MILPALNRGITFATFSSRGSTPFVIDKLHRYVNGLEIYCETIFICFGARSSHPAALFFFYFWSKRTLRFRLLVINTCYQQKIRGDNSLGHVWYWVYFWQDLYLYWWRNHWTSYIFSLYQIPHLCHLKIDHSIYFFFTFPYNILYQCPGFIHIIFMIFK